MGEKRRLKKEIKLCMSTIKEIERKRSRSQSALVQAILLQEQPDGFFYRYIPVYIGGSDGAFIGESSRKSLFTTRNPSTVTTT